MGPVRYLLDTCTFLWYAQQPEMLSANARRALNDSSSDLFVSDVSVFEITLKHSRGKLDLPDSPRVWIPQKYRYHRLAHLPIIQEAVYLSGELPRVHNDPFDRLLAAQAIEENLTILSPDRPLELLGAGRHW